MGNKPTVQDQGKIVVERDGAGYLLMFPDGRVFSVLSKKKVEALARCWFEDNLDQDIGVGIIEWRD